MIRRVFATLVAFAASLAAARGWQAPAQSTAVVIGRAVDSTGAALSGTQVILTPVATSTGAALPAPNVPGAPAGTQRVLVDNAGGFVFRDLSAGRYTLTATRPGYLDAAFGRRRSGGSSQPLEILDGQSVTGVSLILWKFAAIRGTVVDEVGEPVVGISVRILRRTVVAGRPSLVFTTVSGTDDRGVYRATSLAPDTYVATVALTQTTMPLDLADDYVLVGDQVNQVMARSVFNGNPAPVPPPTSSRPGEYVLQTPSLGSDLPVADTVGRVAVYPPQFHSSAATADRATAITIAAGEDRGGIDFTLRTVPGVRVAGTLTGMDGAPVPLQVLRLVAAGSPTASELGTEVAVCATDVRGAFTFLGVPAGEYLLRSSTFPKGTGPAATTPLSTQPTLWLADPVTVGDRDLTIAARFTQGGRVSGRVEFLGTAPKPPADQWYRIQVALEPADGRAIGAPPAGRADATAAFMTYGMPPGRYRVNVTGAPAGWSLKSAMFEGKDLADSPFELKTADLNGVIITLTDTVNRITGAVSDDKGAPDPGASVVMFSIDPRSWIDTGTNPRRLKTVRVSSTGTFTLTPVPGGEYFIAAISDEAAADFPAPTFLEALARRAARITVVDGQSPSVALHTVSIR